MGGLAVQCPFRRKEKGFIHGLGPDTLKGAKMRERAGTHTLRVATACLAISACLLFLIPRRAAAQADGDLDQILVELENYAQTCWDPRVVPGMAYAVVKGSETVYARGFGTRSKGASSGPVDEHTLFEIGSCTKAFNAAVVGTLVDEGAIAWSDKVYNHLHDFKMYDPWVTKQFLVEDLMAHRSGMPWYATDKMSQIGFGREDIRRATRLVEPETSFRSAFAYQNDLHLWAAELVEKKTGLAWEEAVKRRILEPLGMSESTFDFAAYDANPNHAMAHMILEGGCEGREDFCLWTIPSDWPYRNWLSVYAPAGGLTSNVSDMAKWVALQIENGSFGGRVILKPETVRAIRQPRVCLRPEDASFDGVASYATGWVFQSSPATPWYWHTGGTSGMHSIVAIFPEADLGLVVLTNSRGNKLPESLTNKLMELVFGAAPKECVSLPPDRLGPGGHGLEPSRPEGGAGAAAIPLNKLVGTYVNPAYGKAIVKKEGGGLTLTLGPARRRGALSPYDTNQFLFQWPDFPGNISGVLFKADGSGEVTKLTIEGFKDVHGGDFKKVNP